MRTQAQIIDEITEFTNGSVAPLGVSGLDDWIDSWTHMLGLLVEHRVVLPVDLKEDFMRVIARGLDLDADLDDDEWCLEDTRADYLAYLAVEPAVEDFCTVWKPNK